MNLFLRELTYAMPDSEQLVRVLFRLLVSAILGAIVGIQREQTGKPAGLRTHMLVSLGATLFVLVPSEVAPAEIGRVIQGVAAGIGFIGGGAILKLSSEREVIGLTTAAGIWMTAAAGVAVGLGGVAIATLSIAMTWVILAIVGQVERRTQRKRAIKDLSDSPIPEQGAPR